MRKTVGPNCDSGTIGWTDIDAARQRGHGSLENILLLYVDSKTRNKNKKSKKKKKKRVEPKMCFLQFYSHLSIVRHMITRSIKNEGVTLRK